MNQTVKTNSTTIRTEWREDDGISYKYELIMRESSRVASYGMPLYSISVEMKNSDGKITTANTSDVFADPGKAIVFFEKIVKSLATPIDLPYVVEDELSR